MTSRLLKLVAPAMVGAVALFLGASVAHALSTVDLYTTTAGGNWLPKVPFEVYYATGGTSGELYFKNVTDESGYFNFVLDPAGEYAFALTWPSGQATKERVKIGPGLNKLVFRAPAPLPPSPPPTATSGLTPDETGELCKLIASLQPGDESPLVERLQNLLRKLGLSFFSKEPNGSYGPLTLAGAKKANAAVCGGSITLPAPKPKQPPKPKESKDSLPPTPAPLPKPPAPPKSDVKEAAQALQELIVEMRQLLGKFESVLAKLRSAS